MNWKKVFKILAPISTILRIIAPLFIFTYPIYVTLAAILLDWFDGEFYYQWKIKRIIYNYFDKSLDLYWYSITLAYAYFNLPYFHLFLGLYLLRFTGHIIFYLSKSDKAFIYFPNIFEFVFIYILVINRVGLNSRLLEPPLFYKVLIILSFIKIIQEMYAHKFSLPINNIFPEWMRGPDKV